LLDQDQTICAITGIIAVTILEAVALITHTDGQYMSLVVGAIGAIIGAVVGVQYTQSKDRSLTPSV
jgi:uncharacterized membrane protein YeaQ/YmgE (transglycosylase-associated protein family)